MRRRDGGKMAGELESWVMCRQESSPMRNVPDQGINGAREQFKALS